MNRPSGNRRPFVALAGGRGPRAAALVAAAVLLLLVVTCPAAADDGSPPTLADGDRYNVTAIELTVADDTDVDEGTIEAGDFSLSDGDVSTVQVNESGSDARVILFLDGRLQVNDVHVSVADGAIADAAGNEMESESITVTGMDSYVPTVRTFDVERINATDGRIVLSASEPLATMRLQVRGPTNESLNESHFRAVEEDTYGATYEHTYHFPENGEYRVRLESVVDRADIVVNYSRSVTFVRDASDPTAAFTVPDGRNVDDLARFDGSASTDNVGVEAYNWTVDGDVVGDGSVLEYAFDEPGTHEVALTVADARGNRATTNRSVVVHDAPSKRGVTVERFDERTVRATVSTDRPGERVRVADAYGRLVTDGEVTLRSLLVAGPTNETLAFDVAGNRPAPSFASATGETALAAFDVTRGNGTVERPRFRFSVPAAALSRAGVAYSDVSLYRDDGNWTELDTRVVRATKSTVVYEAPSPGLSTFVVGASGDGSLASDGFGDRDVDVRVTDATLASDSVAFGEYAVVEATIVNEDDVDGSSVVGVTVGPEVRETRRVTLDTGETTSVRFALRAVRNGTVAVNGTVAGDLTITGGDAAGTRSAGSESESGSETTGEGGTSDEAAGGNDSGSGGFSIPNPLALWPDGFVGAVLTGVVSVVAVTYAILKSLAIYLGY